MRDHDLPAIVRHADRVVSFLAVSFARVSPGLRKALAVAIVVLALGVAYVVARQQSGRGAVATQPESAASSAAPLVSGSAQMATAPSASAAAPAPAPSAKDAGKRASCALDPPDAAALVTSPGVVLLKQEQATVGHGFLTPQGYVIAPAQLLAAGRTSAIEAPGQKPFSFRIGDQSRFVNLACPTNASLRVKQPEYRRAGSLKPGEPIAIRLGRSNEFTGTLVAKSVSAPFYGAQNDATFDDFLAVGYSLIKGGGKLEPSDIGAPALDRAGKLVGVFFGPKDNVILLLPIDEIMKAFPYAF